VFAFLYVLLQLRAVMVDCLYTKLQILSHKLTYILLTSWE